MAKWVPVEWAGYAGGAVSGNLWKVNIYSFRIYSAEITDLFGADWKIVLLRMIFDSAEQRKLLK